MLKVLQIILIIIFFSRLNCSYISKNVAENEATNQLVQAVKNEDLSEIKKLIDKKADVNFEYQTEISYGRRYFFNILNTAFLKYYHSFIGKKN